MGDVISAVILVLLVGAIGLACIAISTELTKEEKELLDKIERKNKKW